nr:MAG TPA: hypothetical protein [Caudoviricetes sp.]
MWTGSYTSQVRASVGIRWPGATTGMYRKWNASSRPIPTCR